MPPRRAPPRGGAPKKDAPVQKDKINTSTTSTRTTRAAKRAASQAASEAPEPFPSSQEATLPTTPKKRASRAKTATAKKSGKTVENMTSTVEPDNEEPAEAPIPTPKLANKTRGKAKAEVHLGQPTTTRQTRGQKSTIEPEPKPVDNGTKQRATRNNTNDEKAEKNVNVPKPKTRATAAKRDHVVAAGEEVLNDATQGTPKLRKVEPGPVSNSRRSEQEEAGTKHRKPRQKKAASPLPINDPFLEQTAPIEEAQQAAPIEGEEETAPIEEAQTVAPSKGRPARGKKAAAVLVEQEAVDTAPEPVQSNARSLRARKAQPPPPTPNVQRSSRAKIDKGKGKAVDPQPVASQNGAVKDFPAQQQEVNEHTVEDTAIPKRRGRPPKVAVVVQAEGHAEVDQQIVEETTIPKGRGRKQKAAVEVEENIEVNPHPEEEPITLAKPGRARRITKAAEKTPVRRSGRRTQAAEQPEAEGSGGSRAVAVVIEKLVVGGVAGVTAMPEAAVEQLANAETDEVVEQMSPVAKTKKAAAKQNAGKPAKGRGKKAAKPVEEDSDREAKQAIKGQPDQQLMEHLEENFEQESGKGTRSTQAGEVNNVSVPVAPDITATTEESPVASTPANNDSQHDVDEDNALPPTFSQTPIPAPVVFSPSRTTQSFSEPTKSPTPVPSSPLARFSSPAAKPPIVGSRKRDFGDDDVTPNSPPVKRSRSNPSTPLASSSRTTSSSAELTTPNQLSKESTSYTPKATIKHLDIASSPVLNPPRNLDEGENPGKSPIKNATPRSSFNLASMNLVGSVESNRWASDSPRRRSSGVSPMKKQNMSFTELGETKSQAEDGVGNGDDDAGAQTEEDSEFQQNENKEAMEQLTLSKDQMASDFKVEMGVTEKDTLGTQDGAEEYTSPAQVISDNDSELEDSGAMDQLQQENSHPEDDQEGDDQEEDIQEEVDQEEVDQEEDDQEEDVQEEVDQEEVFVDDSTFNNDSLFAIPAEDIPVEGAERSQTENVDQEEAFIDDSTFNNDSLFAIPAEDIPVQGAAENQTQNAEENVVENLAENENTNAADQLNEQPIDVMNALLPSEAQEYYEDTIENINESSLMLRRDMNEIRSRTPTLGGFYQRTSLRETEPSNLSGIFAPGLQLSSDTSFARANASLVPADTSDSFTFDYSAIQRELEANNTIEGTSGLSPIQENEDGEADSQAGYEDMLPDYLTADSNFNTSQRPNNSSLIASSPMSESAIARAISFFGEDSVLEDSRVENNVGWDDQSLVEKSGEFDEEPSQDKSANETEDGQKSDESPEEDQDSPQSDVQNEGSLSSAGYSKENVQEQEHDGDDDEDTTIRGLKQDNEAGDIEDTIRVPKEKNEVEGDEHTITGPEEDDNITIGFSNAVVESLTTSQESIFTDGPPKGSFSTNSGSFESKSSSMDQAMGSPANVARKAANKDVDSLFDTSMTVSTPEVNRTHKFSLPPRFTPSSASKRSLADSPSKKGTPNALNMSPYGMRPEDIPDFDDDFSVIESTPSDRKTPATEQKWITPAGSNTPHHLFSSPSKPKSLLSKLLQEENFEFTDDFSFIEDEKEGANKGEDEADRGENNEKIRSQPGESPGRTSPEAPLGEVQIYAGPITPTHAAGVADAPTGKRKIGTLEPVSVKRGKHVSASSRPIAIEVGDDMNEDISLIDVEDVIGDRKYIRPKGRRQSLRLSYLDSAASNTVCEPEPQSEVYLTPEKSRFQNLNPLFSACPDSVQAKRRGRRTSIGQRRASLELEENAHVYTTMQAAVRGYICRKKLKEAHERANEIPGEISDLGDVTTDKATVQRDLEMAAVVFVSAWKGLKQRRAYLIQRAAAVTIQRAYRKRQAAVSQSAKSAMSVPEDKTEEPATPIPAGPFDGLLKRFDNKKAAETAAISEPESCLPVTQPVVHRHTPRPRRMATHSPVPEKYLYRDPNKYKRAISVEPELKAVAEPPTTSADDDVESKERPTRASGSRIPRSGLRLPVASGMSSTSIGKRKAEDDINEPFVPKFKLTTAQAAAPTPHRTTRVVPGNISLIPGSNPFGNRMIKDSLSKMTQPEVNQLTTRYTARNRRYDIDFERKVVRVERDRSSSPDAKTQHRRALEDRKKRYEVEEETGIVLGPGDPMDYEPEIKTPTRKGVRWHTDLEFGWDEDLEKNSPSAAKKKAKEGFNGIVRKQVPLDPFGNVVGPRPRINETPEKIVISKVLYIGEDDE